MIFSNVCFAGVAKRKAREMPHLNMSSNKDPEEQGSNEELEDQEWNEEPDQHDSNEEPDQQESNEEPEDYESNDCGNWDLCQCGNWEFGKDIKSLTRWKN